jgi:hypothetical protein
MGAVSDQIGRPHRPQQMERIQQPEPVQGVPA